MNVVTKLEELARKVPGVAGYLDRENAREADKALRVQMAEEIGRLRREIDGVIRAHSERRAFALLPLLDRLGSKLDKVASLMRFAGYGYRAVFDRERADVEQLQRLCAYDRELAGQIQTMRAHIEALQSLDDEAAFRREGEVLDKLIDTFEDALQRREAVLG
jgi:hypothetical protein